MSKKITRTGFRLETGALLGLTLLTAHEAPAQEVNATTKITSIHMACRMRTMQNDNFASIAPEQDFVSVELWKEFGENGKWRIEKSGRVAVMDGQSTVLFIKPINTAMKLPQPLQGAFDTQWLHDMATSTQTLEATLQQARSHHRKVERTRETDAEGRAQTVVTMAAKADLPPDDYLRNKFLKTADTRQVYQFDEQTGRLQSVKIYLHGKDGDVLIVETCRIEYNQPIASRVFRLDLPSDVTWYQEPQEQKLPNNAKYASMTAEQAAQAFFKACVHSDWVETEKFMPYTNERLKQYLGGLKIIRIGQGFTSAASSANAQFVPYEIKLRNGEVKTMNLALKKDQRSGCWFIDGGI